MAQEKAKRVLVTGASGFTGRYVMSELKKAGYHTWGSSSKKSINSTFINIDFENYSQICEALDIIRPDAIIHLAAITHVTYDDPGSFYRVNLIGTRNLLEALAKKKLGQKGIILASSANVYGNVQSREPIKETILPIPVNDYGLSKLAMEYVARLFMNQLPIIITRPFNYTGVGQTTQFLIPKIIRHFQEKLPTVELGNIYVKRDFSDIRDIAKFYVSLLNVKESGFVVNLCSGVYYSIIEIIELCKKITGHKIKISIKQDLVRFNEINLLYGDNTILNNIITCRQNFRLPQTLEWMIKGE